MLSKTAEYALRAMVAIARVKEDRPVLAREIARAGRIPDKYLSKVLGDLVHAHVLTSTRGIGGGFKLKRRPEKLRLIDILRHFDDIPSRGRCPLGHSKCTDDKPCGIHQQWKPLKEAYANLLEKTTLADISGTPSTGE